MLFPEPGTPINIKKRGAALASFFLSAEGGDATKFRVAAATESLEGTNEGAEADNEDAGTARGLDFDSRVLPSALPFALESEIAIGA